MPRSLSVRTLVFSSTLSQIGGNFRPTSGQVHGGTSAAGGAEALAEARRSAFDLLRSDVIMPGMNGAELYRKIAEIVPGLKVLYISGYPAGSGSRRSIFEGGEHFLHKPLTIAELPDKVHTVMDAAV